ncbi:MAG: hypothetical protein A2Y18_06765 [Clostridiales bacterium GWD2_32_19]|nr:MAG: hypothetical protein A2Y18_06765 [Clostridiales bacterium GWD2_32_19]
MNNTNGHIKPDVLVTDFDRTLTYLYKDPSLLPELANKIRTFYGGNFYIPENYLDSETDGYKVWYKLHDIAIRELPQTVAVEINEQAENIVADFELQIVKRVGLFHDIPKVIRNLRSNGIRLGVVSSNSTPVVQFALEEAEILNEFEYVRGRPYPFNPKLIKPNPFPLNKALTDLKVDPGLFWYVGDDIVDMVAATAANVTAVGVCTGRHSESELIKSGANLVFQSFINIPEYFKV